MSTIVDTAFWQGKKVFLTGHTGFKGSWLALWLEHLGANIKGFSLDPPTSPSLYQEARVAEGLDSEHGDIRDLAVLTRSMTDFAPDIVIHMAAQPLVRKSFYAPIETYATNVMGSLNVLEAARQSPSLRAIVNVTTDKCYENREWVWGYREDEPMGGHDPYSSSKGCVELLTAAYRHSFLGGGDTPALATARAGNVIAGGDWATDRLIPDILRSFEKGTPVLVRHPDAIRPWQHVLEPLGGYLVLAQQLWQHGQAYAQAWNFGPRDQDARSVAWILDRMASCWGDGAHWRHDEGPTPHEAQSLKLDISKARTHLGWSPVWSLDTTLPRIVDWHRAWRQGQDARQRCLDEITAYQASMATRLTSFT